MAREGWVKMSGTKDGRSVLDGTDEREGERGGKRERGEGDVDERRPDFIQDSTAAIETRRSKMHPHNRVAQRAYVRVCVRCACVRDIDDGTAVPSRLPSL
jgi:hypothetical protein